MEFSEETKWAINKCSYEIANVADIGTCELVEGALIELVEAILKEASHDSLKVSGISRVPK